MEEECARMREELAALAEQRAGLAAAHSQLAAGAQVRRWAGRGGMGRWGALHPLLLFLAASGLIELSKALLTSKMLAGWAPVAPHVIVAPFATALQTGQKGRDEHAQHLREWLDVAQQELLTTQSALQEKEAEVRRLSAALAAARTARAGGEAAEVCRCGRIVLFWGSRQGPPRRIPSTGRPSAPA